MANGHGKNGGAVLDAPVKARGKNVKVSVPAENGQHSVAEQAHRITAEKAAELEGMAAAIGRSQAIIEFGMDGTILSANENFLRALGYTLDEIKGRHHRMFVDPAEQNTPAYAEFWAKLRRGEYQTAEYKRIGKGGQGSLAPSILQSDP